MNDCRSIGDEIGQTPAVAQIADHWNDARIIRPDSHWIACQDAHSMSRFGEPRHEMPADEAAPSGNGNHAA